MATKPKRNIGAEIVSGLEEIRAFQAGKKTLRTHTVTPAKVEPMSAKEVRAAREKMKMSQSVFAATMGLNKRTLERWENGDARPNASTTILIKMALVYGDTIPRIQTVTASRSQAESGVKIGRGGIRSRAKDATATSRKVPTRARQPALSS